MHRAEVTTWGEAPKYTSVSDFPAPAAGQVRIKVEAAGAPRVTRSRAAGKHYTAKTLPHVVGVDGVGQTDDGRRVYFTTLAPGAGGSLSDYVNVAERDTTPLPTGADPIQIAALVNPGLSSWLGLQTRTQNLPKDFTVLILGATSASGRLAIPLARALGAKRVVGAARNTAAMQDVGLDETITVADEATQTDFSTLGDVDVILDYIFGPLTVHLLRKLHSTRPVQYVHIGGLSATEITLPGDVLRGNNLTIRGSGPGAWSMSEAAKLLPGLLEALASIEAQAVRVVPLKDVESEWDKESAERLVFVP